MAFETVTKAAPATPGGRRFVTPSQWDATLSAPPVLSSETGPLRDGLLRRWQGTSARMEQPRLDHHYIVMHLGGAKRVRRDGEGASLVTDVPANALTIVPAGSEFVWNTSGPIDFAHLYIKPSRLERISIEEFDREPNFALLARTGVTDALLQALYWEMMGEIAHPSDASGLYLETLQHCFLVKLLRNCSTLKSVRMRAQYSLPPRKLRRVLEFVDANLAHNVDLAALASVAGLSKFHFCRTFQRATGTTPYAFVIEKRIALAKRLLRDDRLAVGDIAQQCGFRSPAQFATSFKKSVGESPTTYRYSSAS